MIREAIIFTLLATTLWCLHGMDMQYYALTSPTMFEINLFMATISVIGLGVITTIDLRRVRRGVA